MYGGRLDNPEAGSLKLEVDKYYLIFEDVVQYLEDRLNVTDATKYRVVHVTYVYAHNKEAQVKFCTGEEIGIYFQEFEREATQEEWIIQRLEN